MAPSIGSFLVVVAGTIFDGNFASRPIQEDQMGATKPVVIDCDPGIDDAVCIALALASPEIDLLAVTTVAGNATVDVTTVNASAVLAACGRSDIPVGVGARRALVHAYDHGLAPPHGADGIGGAQIAPSSVRPTAEHAVYLLRDVLLAAAPHSVTVVAIAPLTNIALLASLHPELLDRIDRLVVMGGSASRGNITPVAEFNVWTDPESAQRVLSDLSLDVCLIGLDVTRHATLTESHLGILRQRSPLGGLIADMVWGYRDRNADGWSIHDAVTIASIVDPSLLRTAPIHVEVDTGTGLTRGQTICEFADSKGLRVAGEGRFAAAGHVQMGVDLDVDGFRRLLMDRIGWEPGTRKSSAV
jgi:pyrimidine-specific ribonucleoside hydrolase